eukprot:4067452-Amphidinium_carterae.2
MKGLHCPNTEYVTSAFEQSCAHLGRESRGMLERSRSDTVYSFGHSLFELSEASASENPSVQ